MPAEAELFSASGSSAPARPSPAVILARFAGLAAALFLYRPYAGIVHDARIYIGNALATSDPYGVGRDLMFARGRQSEFSAFSPAIDATTRLLGPTRASMLISFLGLMMWLGAALWLTRQLSARASMIRWLTLVGVIVLPASYGGFEVLSYAESYATPRPYAEAAALAGLAALAGRRGVAASALLALSALIHPLMALPAIAVAVVVLAVEDRRWLLLPAVGVAAVLGAAFVGLPVAARLLQTADTRWMAILRVRNSYLFPGRWGLRAWGPVAVGCTTVAVAAAYLQGRPRRLLLAVAGVAIAGTAAAYGFGELAGVVLVLQLQPWRALWLLSIAANACLPLAAWNLHRAGNGGKLVMAVLLMAWFTASLPELAIPLCMLVLVLHALNLRNRLQTGKGMLRAVWFSGATLALLITSTRLWVLLRLVSSARRAGAPLGIRSVLVTGLLGLPVACLAILIAIKRPHLVVDRLRPAGAAMLAALALLAAFNWDDRPASQRFMEAAGSGTKLRQLLPGGTSEILWVDGDVQTWLLAGRPNWAAGVQGAGIVFSRSLALYWDARMAYLVDAGLVRESARAPFREGGLPAAPVRPSARSVIALCSRPDAPAAVVLPGDAPPPLSARRWRPPEPRFTVYSGARPFNWERVDYYSVVACRSAAVLAQAVSPGSSPSGSG